MKGGFLPRKNEEPGRCVRGSSFLYDEIPPIAVLFFVHNGFRPPVAGADADGVFDVEDEDSAVADRAGLADALGRFG